jgi:hypothetical protein
MIAGEFHRAVITIMRRLFIPTLITLCILTAGFGLASAQGQELLPSDLAASYTASYPANARSASDKVHADPPVLIPSRALIINNLIDAETKFRETVTAFSFRRDVVLQTIGKHGEVTGEYIRNSIFVLDDRGGRIEQVLYHPKPSIKEMTITKEDIQDLAGTQLFGLETSDLDAYNLDYTGEEILAGRAAYLVQVAPKQEPDPHQMSKRYFVGRIWIDKATFQIVRLRGTTEPHGKQRFPVFETTRDLQVEDLCFPSSTQADDVLHFPHRDVHYRISVRYHDFKRFASRLRIIEVND